MRGPAARQTFRYLPARRTRDFKRKSFVKRSEENHLEITFELNGQLTTLTVSPWETALSALRDRLRLTGTKEGCGIGECGACTIMVDGLAVDSCLMLAAQLDGRNVETIEGQAVEGELNQLQDAFLSHGAVQCGFCTPGIVMSAKALLHHKPCPNHNEIVDALSGNLCRCTGYAQIVEAVKDVVEHSPANPTVEK
jgi:carbon-monoxide dehydrogenase small subunit